MTMLNDSGDDFKGGPFDTPDIGSREFPAMQSQADICGTPWGGEIQLGSQAHDDDGNVRQLTEQSFFQSS